MTDPLEAVRAVTEPGVSIQELWQWFVLFAALLLPLDVAARRIALPVGEILAKALASLRNRRTVEQTLPTHVERLHAAKKRATKDSPGPVTPPVPGSAQASTPRQPVKPQPKAGTGQTAASLLEAKRKRRDGE